MGAEQSQLAGQDIKQNSVGFFINGKEYNVITDLEKVGPKSLLVDYIRDSAGLKGTKYMCREGGCGACVVTVKSKDPNSGQDVVRAVNSCLIPVFSCDGWDITTVEKVGSKKSGYHQIQKRLVNFSGTQCGFCSPGMVMSMYSLAESKKGFRKQDVEDSFDGNICRCTGYRPILDAFKSLAMDASEELRRKCGDIEDCGNCPCPLSKDMKAIIDDVPEMEDYDTCHSISKMYIRLKSGEEWIKASTMDLVFEAIQRFKSEEMAYRLVAGNTGTGVFKNDGPYLAYVDINNVPELSKSTIERSKVVLGSGVTLTEAIDLLKKASDLDGYEYTGRISTHLKRVANLPVRNVATLGGNLMLKHVHKEFPSDVFMLLETVGAKLNIASAPNLERLYSLLEFLNLDMAGKVIVSIQFPQLKGYNFRSFKITRRYQNAHAYVNAGFLFKVDPKRNFSIREKPSIVFGGINPNFTHAFSTEIFCVGKFLGDLKTLQGALDALDRDVQPDNKPPDASPDYRKLLTQSLFYKVVLEIIGTTAKSDIRTGAGDIEHELTYGKQTFDIDKTDWPLYEPIPKLEATYQCSGEAEYINDIDPQFGELFGAFVLSTVASASIKLIDASAALQVPGVVKFIEAKDIPGANNYMIFSPSEEEIFVKDKVRHAGQSLGMILADTRDAAFEGVKKVSVMYDNIQKPVLTIRQALKKAELEGKEKELILEIRKSVTESVGAPTQTVKGEFDIGGQYHFQMETHICICNPKEDGMDVFASTQWMDGTQAVVSSALGIPNNSINIQVRRLGGGYGCKISRSNHVAAACAVAAQVTNKPVRVALDLETNMRMIGKRLPYLLKYEAGIDDAGNLVSLKAHIFCDPGQAANEATSLFAMLCMQSCYKANGWQVIPGRTLTNTPSNTYCRAPGSTQGIACVEFIMEHIAHTLKKDPLQIRELNFIKTGDAIFAGGGATLTEDNPLPTMITDLKQSADYDDRKKFIETFNQNNRWKKRGMSLVPMRYPIHFFDVKFPVYIAVYHADGSVVVSHSGIEMGQGINTKVAQTVAFTLKIPLEKIKVKPANNVVSANSSATGGAVTSELVCHSAVQAAQALVDKMAPIKAKLTNPSWETLIAECYKADLDLTSHYQQKPGEVQPYNVWGLTLLEVEIDILTGEYKMVRMDLVEDAGKSLSPDVDIGQIEGAAIMGLGLWTTEKLVYDENSGELLTHNTWEYKVPLPKDIPQDMRITMLKNAPNPLGVLRSKATGEPPICMSVCILFAIKNAIDSARQNAGNTDWYQIDSPITPEDILKHCLTSKTQFTF